MNWHVGVLFAAQLLTLAVEIADAICTEPCVSHKSRNGILFNAQRRHRESMNHVVCSGDDADFFAHGHHQSVVDLQQVIVASGFACIGHFAMRIVQSRNEANAFAFALDVVIAPFPLVTSGFDGEVGIGGVFGGHQNFGSRQCHQDHDDEGHDGPNDFNRHGLMKLGGLVTH